MSITDQMQNRSAARARAISPDGTAHQCQRCWAILPAPARHFAIMTLECPDGDGNFRLFVDIVEKPEPRVSIPVFVPAPRQPRMRRAR